MTPEEKYLKYIDGLDLKAKLKELVDIQNDNFYKIFRTVKVTEEESKNIPNLLEDE